MTPSKLKEQLMAMWKKACYRRMEEQFIEQLCDVILEQQAALALLAKFEQKPWKYECECAVECARSAIAATNAKLKALGCAE